MIREMPQPVRPPDRPHVPNAFGAENLNFPALASGFDLGPHRSQTVQHKISDYVCDVHLSTFAFATTKSFAGGSRKGNVVTESGVLALRSSEELGDGQHIEEVLISLSVK